jgi:hypothetical protein
VIEGGEIPLIVGKKAAGCVGNGRDRRLHGGKPQDAKGRLWHADRAAIGPWVACPA